MECASVSHFLLKTISGTEAEMILNMSGLKQFVVAALNITMLDISIVFHSHINYRLTQEIIFTSHTAFLTLSQN